MKLELSTVLTRRSDVRYRVIDKQAVVIVQQQAEALILNGLGTRILGLIDGVRRITAIVERLLPDYEVDREILQEDVLKYLKDLAEIGVLVEVPQEDDRVG